MRTERTMEAQRSDSLLLPAILLNRTLLLGCGLLACAISTVSCSREDEQELRRCQVARSLEHMSFVGEYDCTRDELGRWQLTIHASRMAEGGLELLKELDWIQALQLIGTV